MMGEYLDSKNTKIDITGLEKSILITQSTTELKIDCPFTFQSMMLVNAEGEVVGRFDKNQNVVFNVSTLSKGSYRLIVNLSEVKILQKEVSI